MTHAHTKAGHQGTGTLNLVPGAPRFLHPALGTMLVVTEGAVWVTQSGDLEDRILEVGDSFAVARPEVLLSTLPALHAAVGASQAARVLIIEPAGAAAHRYPMLRHLGAAYLWAMRHVGGSGHRHHTTLPY